MSTVKRNNAPGAHFLRHLQRVPLEVTSRITMNARINYPDLNLTACDPVCVTRAFRSRRCNHPRQFYLHNANQVSDTLKSDYGFTRRPGFDILRRAVLVLNAQQLTTPH